jgi:hypothetical protein
VDKVIVKESSFRQLPSTHIRQAFKEVLGSLKHIAAFVTGEKPPQDYRLISYSRHEEAWYWFPQMETFTAITVGRIEASSWILFTKDWGERDALRMPLPPIDLFQDNSLFYSWLALDRKERYIERKARWESEKNWEARKRAKRMTRAERAKFEREKKLAGEEEEPRWREERRRCLAGYLGKEWGEKEESKEWERWVKEKQREG